MMKQEAPQQSGETRQVILGVLLTLGLHLIQFLLTLVVAGSWALIGVTQLVYVVPAALIARRRGKAALMKGIIIGAALTFLLNATLFGVIWWMLSNF